MRTLLFKQYYPNRVQAKIAIEQEKGKRQHNKVSDNNKEVKNDLLLSRIASLYEALSTPKFLRRERQRVAAGHQEEAVVEGVLLVVEEAVERHP